MIHELSALFSSISVGNPLAIGDLTFFPLLALLGALEVDLLEDGKTTVSEVGEEARVGRVRVDHRGEHPLLLLDGEQIVGAKQNRMVNASFLVPSGGVVDVPVSCVERGRWAYRERAFAPSSTVVASATRCGTLRRVVKSVAAGQGYDANQGEVWQDVDHYLERTAVGSPTSAYWDAHRSRQPYIEAQLGDLPPQENQVGIAAVRGDTLVGMDIFASAGLYARVAKKVLRGIFAEVSGPRPASDAMSVLKRAAARVLSGTATRSPAPGCGETLHGSGEDIVFGGVLHEGRIVHAFVAEGEA